MLTKKLSKHGNSLALVIDRSILELLEIDEGTTLQISTDGRARSWRQRPASDGETVPGCLDRLQPAVRPGDHHPECTSRKRPVKQGERFDAEFRFRVAVDCMEVRWIVVVEIHPNRNTKKATHLRHGRPLLDPPDSSIIHASQQRLRQTPGNAICVVTHGGGFPRGFYRIARSATMHTQTWPHRRRFQGRIKRPAGPMSGNPGSATQAGCQHWLAGSSFPLNEVRPQ